MNRGSIIDRLSEFNRDLDYLFLALGGLAGHVSGGILSTATRTIDVRIAEYVRQLVRPLIAGITMNAAFYALEFWAYGSPGEWLYLIQLVLVGILAYGMAMLLIDREGLKETMELIRAWQLIPSHDA